MELTLWQVFNLPILYLSRYVIQNKKAYYENLQGVRDNHDWESWILFMLDDVEKTAQETIALIQNIKMLMQDYKNRIRKNYSFYSQELLNNLFKHPYTKIEFIERDLDMKRLTASKYLNALVDGGFLDKVKVGKSNFYINTPLYNLLINKTL